jgi:hypothetical protein
LRVQRIPRWLRNRSRFSFSEALHDENIPALRNFAPWVTAAVLIVVASYYMPLHDITYKAK